MLSLWVNLSWFVQLQDTGLQSHPACHPALSFGWLCIPSGGTGLLSFCCGPATETERCSCSSQAGRWGQSGAETGG